jgi:hypothetical protein
VDKLYHALPMWPQSSPKNIKFEQIKKSKKKRKSLKTIQRGITDLIDVQLSKAITKLCLYAK